jgi:DNA-binding transcriptional regulator YiaG
LDATDQQRIVLDHLARASSVCDDFARIREAKVSTVKKSAQQIRRTKGRIDHARVAAWSNADREQFRRKELGEDGDFGPPRFVVPAVEIRRLRADLGLSQDEFADRYLLPRRTVQEWEQHRREPSEPARVLLFAISRDPQAVERALRRPKKI